uniref:Cytochrome c6 n=1 Tax=Sciadococcus taiwanensis TaxID=3028030 RepID=A0A9Y1I283_9RHOD|nr:cytochrome c553 [Sciadococcus taiwanensis]
MQIQFIYKGDKILKKVKNLIILSFLSSVFISYVQLAQAADIENGEQVFSANCSACHAGGDNIIMPEKTLKTDALEANGMKSISAISDQISNGKNAMPAFGGRLDDSDISDVANYVLSQAEKGW